MIHSILCLSNLDFMASFICFFESNITCTKKLELNLKFHNKIQKNKIKTDNIFSTTTMFDMRVKIGQRNYNKVSSVKNLALFYIFF